ncbi:unnamed protein product [Protopolystoma xenopodis]|uniref:Innexin n=1 Tax=Protopolystoma xenopodis TaxID=117903 RepID=A0A3S4ZVH0_9PLAT|nr:unnamed protein product [Protopolystoma xenopodis]
MVGSEFIDLFTRFSNQHRVAIEDLGDRINQFTVLIFLLAAIVVSVKQYMLNAISCYVPISPTGSDFPKFLSDYCWVHGTIPLRSNEPMPSNPRVWDEFDKYRRISKSYQPLQVLWQQVFALFIMCFNLYTGQRKTGNCWWRNGRKNRHPRTKKVGDIFFRDDRGVRFICANLKGKMVACYRVFLLSFNGDRSLSLRPTLIRR